MENASPYEKLMQALDAYFQEQSPEKLQAVRDAHAHCRREERKFGVEAVIEDEDDDEGKGDWLQEAVQEKVTAGQSKYLSVEVIDSR